MAEKELTQNLVSSRNFLKNGLQKSTEISSELAKTGPRLKNIQTRLKSLKSEMTPLQNSSFLAIGDQIDQAIGNASAVLNIFNTISQLQKALFSVPCSNLSTFILLVKQLEEALKFLSNDCTLAIQWFDGIAEFFEDDAVTDQRCLVKVKKCLRILQDLRATEEHARLDGGFLSTAMDRLQLEFRRLLTEINDRNPTGFALSASVVQKLQMILDRLNADNRLENCLSIYIEVRNSNAKRLLQALDLNYLQMSISDLNDAESIEGYIDKWSGHLEHIVKNLFDLEYKLCNDIFVKIGSDVSTRCLAEVTMNSGFLSFLQFGKNVTQIKEDPAKLFNLLDIFWVLNNLRNDMNKLFGGEACTEIQMLTRDLVKRVIDGILEIFSELPVLVESQRRSSPSEDGSVPSLVTFVTDYCNKLLGDKYKPILTLVLIIHQSWKQDTNQENLLSIQIYSIIKELALNLDAWSKAYEDVAKSYYFMMNNHCHFSNLNSTRLGEMMGNSWITAHEQYKEYYAAIYLKESWGNLPSLLYQKGQASNDMLKKRLKEFNEGFYEGYKKQSNWIICDGNLGEKMSRFLVQSIVPVYRSYMKNYVSLVKQDSSASKYVNYTAQNLEDMINSMFKHKMIKYESLTKPAHFTDKIDQFQLTLAVM